MNFAKLQIRDGGIFANYKVPAAELRARAFLAQANAMGKLEFQVIADTHSKVKIVLLYLGNEDSPASKFSKSPSLVVNEGCIATADLAAWSAQPGLMALCLPFNTKKEEYHALLARYFKASHRWLADNVADREEIERVISSMEVKA